MAKVRDAFQFKRKWIAAISKLSDADQLIVYQSICAYAFGDELPKASPLAQVALDFITQELDDDKARADDISVKRREAVRKRYNCIQNLQMNTKVTNDSFVDFVENKEGSFPTPLLQENIQEKKILTKVNIKEKKKIAESVTMTDEELAKLKEKFGEADTQWMIDKLSAYKTSKGKTYKSDYMAILSWVTDELAKRKSSSNYGKDNLRILGKSNAESIAAYGESTI